MDYHISFNNPLTHFLEISLKVKEISEDLIIVRLPSWRPGRYEIANFAKNIQRVEVLDNHGHSLPFIKITKDSWQIPVKGIPEVEIKYNYFAFEMDAGNSWLDDNQVYINFINCMMYLEGREDEECTINFDLPEEYIIACGLRKVGKHQLLAPNYYQLVDSPMIASDTIKRLNYTVRDCQFHIWIQGLADVDEKKVIKDFKAFTSEQVHTLGDFPCKDYHFLFQLLPYKHYHGVEHFNSTIITLGPASSFNEGKMYSNFMGISSHELFHTWNVIRIRPKEMLPYDFSKENYFQTGYVAEGFTTYYGDLFLIRSGVFDKKWYFNEVNGLFKRHFENFGRFNLSVADSSFDLWLDGYVPGIPNRKTSIYIKGALTAMMLDLEIRQLTNDTKSLDALMRILWDEFGKKGIGYGHTDIVNITNELTMVPMEVFFEDYIMGSKPIETKLNELLQHVGCGLYIKENDIVNESYFGFRVNKTETNKVIIKKIEPGSIAEKHLSIEDEVLEANGVPVTKMTSGFVIEKGTVTLKIIRSSQEKEVRLQSTDSLYFKQFLIEQKKDATISQKGSFQKWLKCEP